VRILLYGDVDLSLAGGLETHLRQLAHGLTARGHDVEVYGRPVPLPDLHMVDRVEPSRYDILHHHGGAWPRGLEAGRHYVKTLHFCTAAKMRNYVRLGRVKTLANPGNWRAVAEERATVGRRGRLIAVAARVVRDFGRWYGLDPARAVVIPNGATFAPPRETREAIRNRFGIDAAAPVLLTIGRADYVKGHDLIERAWERARTPGAVWVAVGGDAPAHTPGRVVTGTLSHADAVAWIHAADFAAMPSYYEGCSVAMIEMLAGGAFVLAHDVGNADEIIDEGRNGRLVAQTVDAWTNAFATVLRERPRGTGLDLGFRWDGIVERTETVYREMLAG
jgi:glycosyltransferase involved in cell wall biosynthesis